MFEVLFTLFALATIIAIWRMSRPLESAPQPRPRLRMSLNPQAHASISPVWVLSRDPACSHTAGLPTGPVAVAKASTLETLGCAPGRCNCHYTPMAERRRRLRRIDEDRRDEIRFAAEPDRRSTDRRHQDQLWALPGHQR